MSPPRPGRLVNRAYVLRWIKSHDFFVAHGLRDKRWVKLFRQAVERGVHGTGWKPFYMDEAPPAGCELHIFQDYIKHAIRSLDFGIYDLSFKRPNVFLELGTALAFAGKDAYIVFQSGKFSMDNELSDLAGIYRGDCCEYKTFHELTVFIRKNIVRHRRLSSRILPTGPFGK